LWTESDSSAGSTWATDEPRLALLVLLLVLLLLLVVILLLRCPIPSNV
jgi:hypothetical protein